MAEMGVGNGSVETDGKFEMRRQEVRESVLRHRFPKPANKTGSGAEFCVKGVVHSPLSSSDACVASAPPDCPASCEYTNVPYCAAPKIVRGSSSSIKHSIPSPPMICDHWFPS